MAREAKAETLERLRAYNEAQTDWWGKCPDGKIVRGSLADLRKACDGPPDPPPVSS